MRTPEMRLSDAVGEVCEELRCAMVQHGPFHSAHEGLSVIEEEVDELRKEVYKRRENRDPGKMYKEASHVAAMGLRFMIDIAMLACEKADSTPKEKPQPDPLDQEERLRFDVAKVFNVLADDGSNIERAKYLLYNAIKAYDLRKEGT